MWKVKEVNKSALAKFIRATGLKESLARLLFLRDVKTQESAQKFLNPQLSDLHSPSLLPDIEKALERIIYALKNRESILIWGHEDLDGITSTVILYETLRDLRASDIQYYIPEKHVEKHGLNSAKVKAVNQIKLVITVDCGITNFSDVQELKDSGIDTVIIEHHEVLDKLPDALANIDPKRKDSKYPFRGLAAAGVTLKIVMALSEKLLKIKPDEFFSIKPDLLALTALGTISDRVPLLEENRILVKYGLEQIKKTSIPAIRVLLEHENLDSFDLTADKLLGHLLPLFASANGNQGCQYFLNDNYEANRAWVQELSTQRMRWKEEANQALAIAEKYLDLSAGLLIVRSGDLPLKTLGHCASKLKERFQVPAIIIGKRDETWLGECRGMDGVNLVDLLKANEQYFIDYGGHKKASGFSILEENIEPFIQGAKDYARKNFAGKIKAEEIIADLILPLSELSKEYTELGPFGEGNPSPLLIAPNTTLQRVENRLFSPDNPNLTLKNNFSLPGSPDGSFDLLYTFDENLTVYIKQTLPK